MFFLAINLAVRYSRCSISVPPPFLFQGTSVAGGSLCIFRTGLTLFLAQERRRIKYGDAAGGRRSGMIFCSCRC
ncbi:hypothetical protein CW304_32935 [Bacillus sp. UFRGS-B20]|nr:hypothetical protein CW304_32935 [Bacillus sp. UFRGS-B20]